MRRACCLPGKRWLCLIGGGATRKKVTFGFWQQDLRGKRWPLGGILPGKKWPKTGKLVTLMVFEPGKRWLCTRKNVALGRGTLSHQDYPEKGDLVFRLFSLNRLSKRDLCPFKEVFQNTRKKVTFIGIEARKKNIRKSFKKEWRWE
jgi:hypothetical protein